METQGEMWTIVLIGLSIVFLSLLALVAMVGFFKFLFAAKAKTPAVAAQPATPVQAARGVDAAVVAVIISAIAASMGVSTSSFTIKSIEHAGFNTPVWGHVDRV